MTLLEETSERVFFFKSTALSVRVPSICGPEDCQTPDNAMVGLDHVHMKTCTIERNFPNCHTLHRCPSHNVYVLWGDVHDAN